ncbi:MAG: hypothetical protein IJY56_02770 [Clostridia bacterium]|nr:hypothetical protein [Clostridia bacterium]
MKSNTLSKFKLGKLLLCVLLSVALFTGCGDGEAVSSVTSGETSSIAEVPAKLTKENEQKPFVVVNRYNKDDVFVATIDVTKAPYYADNTGKTDATQAIQMAMTHARGYYNGGTVYLPAGIYTITKSLSVQSTVTLRGEYNPDCLKTGDYGTVLSIEHQKCAVNMMQGTGIHGISFYYPNQSIKNPIETDYTIKCTIGVHTLQDICFINSYKGFQFGQRSGGGYGKFYFKNVHGTVLYQGAALDSGADAMYGNDIYFSPDYWVKAGSKYNAPAEADLRSWMLKNSECGISISGCEGPGIVNGLIDGYKNGIYTPQTARTDNADTYAYIYGLDIINTVNAVNTPTLYWDMALEFAKCNLEGSSYAVRNLSAYPVKLFNCTGKGNLSGKVEQTSDDVDLPDVEFSYLKPAKNDLFNVADYDGLDPTGKKDSSDAIQKALDAAKANGGGFVYVPGGTYRLEKPLTVYAGTELRGTAGSYIPLESGTRSGTNFFVYYGKDQKTALITLAGNGAGVKGITVYYPKNGLISKDFVIQDPDVYSPIVRGTAENVYVQCMAYYGAYIGFEMNKADNFTVEFCEGGIYKTSLSVKNCNGGVAHMISGGPHITSLAAAFSFYPDFNEWAKRSEFSSDKVNYMDVMFVNFGTKMHDCVVAENSKNLTLISTGMYRSHRLLVAKNSDIVSINHLASRSGVQNYAYELEGGNLLAVNTLYKDITVVKADAKAKYGIYNNKGQIMPAGVSEDNYVRK